MPPHATCESNSSFLCTDGSSITHLQGVSALWCRCACSGVWRSWDSVNLACMLELPRLHHKVTKSLLPQIICKSLSADVNDAPHGQSIYLYKFILKKCTNLNSTIETIYSRRFVTTQHDFAHPCTMVPNTFTYGSNSAIAFQEIAWTQVNLQKILLICNLSPSAENPLAYTTVSHHEHQVRIFFFPRYTQPPVQFQSEDCKYLVQYLVNAKQNKTKQYKYIRMWLSDFLKHTIISQGTLCWFAVQ